MIIRNIENDNGKKTDTNGILNSFRSFYEQLFTKEPVEETLNVISFENLYNLVYDVLPSTKTYNI